MKKRITFSFDLNIPKQEKAYRILEFERRETGMFNSMIVHEALIVYAKSKGYSNIENLLMSSKVDEEIKNRSKENEVSQDVKRIENYDEPAYADNYSDLIN